MENTTATIFIIDDDVSARAGLNRLMQTAGYNTKIYANASTFIKEVQEDTNSCIVLDVRISGLTGSEVHKELISRGVSIPVIVISADPGPETRLKAKQIGAVAFFRKPVDGPALIDTIEWTITQHRQKTAESNSYHQIETEF